MQSSSFDAALNLILQGPADQPVTRILRAATELADCPIGMIGVRTSESFRIVVSVGLPLSSYRLDLTRSETLVQYTKKPLIINDATQDPEFSSHVFVTGPPFARFIACIPLPLQLTPFPFLMMCIDPRNDRVRRRDLIERLEQCAVIAADELGLIADIATQDTAITEFRTTTAMRDASVQNASMPMALVRSDGTMRVANSRLGALVGKNDVELQNAQFDALFPMDSLVINRSLSRLFEDGEPVSGIIATLEFPERTMCRLDMIRVATTEETGPLALCTLVNQVEADSTAGADASQDPVGAESQSVVTDFLLRSLIVQKRLLRRGPVPFHALRRWRAPVKDVQIHALKALKTDPPRKLLEVMADELSAASKALYGESVIQAVTSVPCGNSGPQCLAAQVAPLVAARLQLPHIVAFEPLQPSGGSHPQGNVRRKKMNLIEPIKVPTLLLDDVATSGAHLAEAALLLKDNGTPAVLPLVWLAAG
jgi:predicted amidophosphoribosyltransferase